MTAPNFEYGNYGQSCQTCGVTSVAPLCDRCSSLIKLSGALEKAIENDRHRQTSTAASSGADQASRSPNTGAHSPGSIIPIPPGQDPRTIAFTSTTAAGGLTFIPTATLGHAYVVTPGRVVRQEPAPAFHDAGMRAGEIIGWRAWTLSHGILRSMFTNFRWLPGRPMVGGDANEYCRGVYAFKTKRRALRAFKWSGHKTEPVVIGKVALWGTVYEHEDGYRAEYAYPESLEYIYGFTPRWWHRYLTRYATMLEQARRDYLK